MFSDNYGWLLRDTSSGEVAAVDPAEPSVVQEALDERYAFSQHKERTPTVAAHARTFALMSHSRS